MPPRDRHRVSYRAQGVRPACQRPPLPAPAPRPIRPALPHPESDPLGSLQRVASDCDAGNFWREVEGGGGYILPQSAARDRAFACRSVWTGRQAVIHSPAWMPKNRSFRLWNSRCSCATCKQNLGHTQTNCLDEQGRTQDGEGTGEKQFSGFSGHDPATITAETTAPTICDRRPRSLSAP